MNLQVQEAELTPKRVSPKKSIPRHNPIKLFNTKDKGKYLENSQNNTLPKKEQQFE